MDGFRSNAEMDNRESFEDIKERVAGVPDSWKATRAEALRYGQAMIDAFRADMMASGIPPEQQYHYGVAMPVVGWTIADEQGDRQGNRVQLRRTMSSWGVIFDGPFPGSDPRDIERSYAVADIASPELPEQLAAAAVRYEERTEQHFSDI